MLFGLIMLFVLQATPEEHLMILKGAGFSALVCILIYLMDWLTLDGTKAAWILGWITFGLGQLNAALILLTFFVTSSIVSKDVSISEDTTGRPSRRNARQVWANGFWLAITLMIWFVTRYDIFFFAGAGSIAAATADTWATEIGGHRVKGKTWNISNFKTVKPGADGGISIAGTLASILGSLTIGMLTFFLFSDSSIWLILTITLSGLSGSLADSVLGAIKQGEHMKVPLVFGKVFECNIDNDFVNWTATGTGALVFLILGSFIL